MNNKIINLVHFRAIIYVVILIAVIASQNLAYLLFQKISTNINFADTAIKVLYLAFVILLASYVAIRVKLHSTRFLIDSCFIYIVYLLFRCDIIPHEQWTYIDLIGHMTYADVILSLPIIALIPHIRRWWRAYFNKTNCNNSQSILDKPIKNESDDCFGYYPDAEQLALRILDRKQDTCDGAFVIGLRGEWGKGKTSYLNLLKIALNKKYKNEVIVLNFNTWLNHTYDQLANNFLKVIAVGVNDISLSNKINDYSKIITNSKIGVISNITDALSFNKAKYSDELFEEVSSKISQFNKLIVVQIDDIDRLTGKEILNTIKLIRNIANFRNVVFIVAYDEQNLCKALNSINIPDTYLEKIFNITYTLPSPTVFEQNKVISNILTDRLNEFDIDCEKHITNFMTDINGDISLRNAKRLLGTVVINCSKLLDEDGSIMIDLTDYLLITYLGIINHNVYNELITANNIKDGYLTDEQLEHNLLQINSSVLSLERRISYYGDVISRQKENNGKKGEENELTDKEYKTIKLTKRCNNPESVELTFNIIKTLFSKDKVCGISHKNSYSMYFARKFNGNLVTKKEFRSNFELGSDNFTAKLQEWVKEKDMYNIDRLISTTELNSYVEWLRFFNDLLSITSNRYVDNLMGEKYIPSPGLEVINDNTKDVELRKNCSIAFLQFLFDKQFLSNNSSEEICKKFAIYQSSQQSIHIASILTRNGEIAIPKAKEIFELYWSEYIKYTKDYNDFNEDFWFAIDDIHYEEKLEVRELVKSHIKENILSFIENYKVEKLVNSELHYVFSWYKANGTTSASGNDIWKPYFIEFLESTVPKFNPNCKIERNISSVMNFNAEDFLTTLKNTFTLFIDNENRSYATQLREILSYIKECKQSLNK